MTTIPLDESLDVGKRLADLRAWQTEWQRIDRLLEEQLTGMSGNNLLELQQSAHISNARRRMEMTLVKQSLNILSTPAQFCARIILTTHLSYLSRLKTI